MTVENQAPSVVERLTNTFSDWLKHRRELNEMRQLTVTDFCRIANDLRLSPAALGELVRNGHTADELPRLLAAQRTGSVAHRADGGAGHGEGLRALRAQAPMRPRSGLWRFGRALSGILFEHTDDCPTA